MTVSSEDAGNDWIDPDMAPELDDAWFDRADLHKGDRLIQRGRPPGSSKVSTTIRFDAEVLEAFRRDGPGWQTRINLALREWLAARRAA
jgi:uncharacterized protein (DUF4415 family)